MNQPFDWSRALSAAMNSNNDNRMDPTKCKPSTLIELEKEHENPTKAQTKPTFVTGFWENGLVGSVLAEA